MALSAQHIRQARLHLRRNDPVMRELISQVGPFTLKPRRDRFLMLARSIVYQQISTKAANSIWSRLEERLVDSGVTAPSLAALSLDEFRSLGISRQKATYLHDLAQQVADGRVVLESIGRCTDESIVEQLTQVKGIGVWTAQMFLIFSIGRLDVLPVTDLGIRTAVRNAYDLPELPQPQQLTQLAVPWRPYATVASWYLWRSLAPATG